MKRTYDFVPRVGLENLREAIVEDAHGDGIRLEAELQRSIDDYRDPWLEADEPATVNQFGARVEVAR